MANLLCLTMVLLPILGITTVAGKGLLFKHMANNGDVELPKNCTDCYVEVNTTYDYKVYGNSYNSIFVSENGFVTFDVGWEWYVAQTAPFLDAVMVAPYWSDYYLPAEIRRSHVWYREETQDTKMLLKAQKVIENNFGDCAYNFKPKALFIVTWSRLASSCEYFGVEEYTYYDYSDVYDSYYDRKRSGDTETPSNKSNDEFKQNSFQLVLATDGCDTYAIFNMHTIEWTWCYADNQMLFNAADEDRFYEHPDPSSYGLVEDTNVGKNGRWAYKISGKYILGPDCERP